MDFLVSIVGSLVSKAAEYTVDPTARQLSYLFKHKTKFLNLRSKVQDLKDARERVQQSVDSATRKGEKIFDDVRRWLTEADEKIYEQAAKQLEEDEEKATKRCFAGFCPDFKSRYQLSRKAEKEANAIAQLLTEKDAFKDVSYHPAVEVTDVIRSVKEYEAFGSRSVAFDEVMAALEDETVSKIGVYGMGGVGKTTLVKEVARQDKVKLSFDEVVFVPVTQTPKAVNLQNEIASQLGMKLDNDSSADVRAARLRDRLKKAKKVLVILDDIWVEQEVDTLGIPSADQHRGCKILMTSRKIDVLKRMDSQPNISIETLKEDEAWNLFKKMAGHIVESSEIRSIAVEVAKRCAGLPIAIATIAKALKPKDKLFEWRDALRQLSKPSKTNFEGIPAYAYKAIELSYKFLEGEELGPIFLLCSIMGHNATVEKLLRYAIGLGFIHDVNTMEDSRDRVLTLVNSLTASSLLLEGSHPNRFDMHDVVRDVAQSIASRDRHWLALFEELPNEEKMKESQLISLQNAELNELLYHELECPTLDYFSIGMDHFSPLKISNDLFKGMQRLKVLEFGKTKFTTLPSSLGFLKTLCTLRLIDCALEDIAIFGELGNLEILDLRGSRMEMLPKEIGQLTRLKLLDLTECGRLKVISPNVLSSLSRLEELYLYYSFDGWEVEGIETPRGNASLVELQHLSRLITLEIHIPDVEAIPKDNLFLGKMKRFKISIGNETWKGSDLERVETSRMLKLQTNKIIHLVNGIKLLLGKTQNLYLFRLEDVEEMLYYPSVESFGQLRSLRVELCDRLKNLFSFSIARTHHLLEVLEVSDCKNLTELIVEKEEISENDTLEFSKLRILTLDRLDKFNGSWHSENTFQSVAWLFDKKVSCPALEELDLKSVGGIEKIWHIDDQLSGMSFGVQSLSFLRVLYCRKLKYVFTSSMVKSFVHLKELVVCGCDEMEEIIEGTLAATEEERIRGSICVFPKLDFMYLLGLPKSKRFCSGNYPIEFPSLRVLMLQRCPELNTFLCDSGKSGEAPPNYLFNEKVSCPALERLHLASVGGIEKIWHIDDQLSGISFGVQSLRDLNVCGCNKLKYVFTSSMVKSFVHLKTLFVDDCDEMEEIIEGTLAATEEEMIRGSICVFPKLDSMRLDGLPKSKRFCSGNYPIEFPSLRELRLRRCPELNTFLCDSGKSGEAPPNYLFNEKVILPVLEILGIYEMDNLETLWCDQLAQHSFSTLTSINWPSLKKLYVSGCHKVGILFASREVSGSHQPLFWVNESTFPNLRKLTLGWNAGIKDIIWHCETQQKQQLLSHCLPNLKVVKLEGYPEQLTLLPSYLFHLLAIPYLQTLEIRESYFKEMIFQSEEGGEEKPSWLLLSQITELKLYSLLELVHLWKEKEGFPNLRILDVHRCHELKGNLAPSSASFRNLVTLKVCDCDGIIKLITHPTAKSLVHLKEMIITSCRNIEEIIQRGDDHDELSFPLLNSLVLESLPKLESFCSSGNYTFSFPSLEDLVVQDCPKMKMFSQGHSNTPMLHKVRLHWREVKERWEGSLNNTIQHLFREKHAMNEEGENSKEDQSKSFPLLTPRISEEVENSTKDKGSSSTSNFE
ncbi:hypothetical protein F3Y22_tig00110445pilonHSYRG00096 [Hibiscus syriacus]|uniref:AAA+ ATPase domain-containing protein n=1 Tax=Hibiscus syriacus TaxID=106335 RepID=A0A6A3AL27_HIBSY|nr:disease resistance protein At4g27190-like isoform X2 [Hibiscus syriacus]KAE8704738.1 hypothetical protein F3Y22_tig00110445pilonHSYRG00096 [Hibiscus syriacus]